MFLPLHHPGCAALAAASVSLAGISLLRKRYEIGRTSTPYHVLLLTLSGRGSLLTENGERTLHPGEFSLLPVGTSYRYALSGRSWKLAWLHLLNRKRWKKLCREIPITGPAPGGTEIAAAMNLLIVEGNSSSSISARMMVLQSELFLLLLDRLFGTVGEVSPSPYEEPMKALWHEVERDLAGTWTVAMLARRLHVTPGHLHRLVHELHGVTPMQMVGKLRMQRAEYLLRHTPLPIFQIAELVGYTDPFAFTTAFKRATGHPPSALRR